MVMTKPYLEQMRAHVDEDGQLTHHNAVDLLAEVERLNQWAEGFSEAQLKERRLSEECLREVRSALNKSITLQSHYASLLNQYDGGSRKQFLDSQDWIERLREVAGKDSKDSVPPDSSST